jgi:hypothetical protein
MDEIDAAQYRRLAKPRKRKYRNEVQRVPGHRFDSKLELQVHGLLELQEKQGELSNIRHHPKEVRLTRSGVIYKPDYVVFDAKLQTDVWVEAKGFETSDWRIKRRLWMHYGPGLLRIYRAGGAGWPMLHEEIQPPQGDTAESLLRLFIDRVDGCPERGWFGDLEDRIYALLGEV